MESDFKKENTERYPEMTKEEREIFYAQEERVIEELQENLNFNQKEGNRKIEFIKSEMNTLVEKGDATWKDFCFMLLDKQSALLGKLAFEN